MWKEARSFLLRGNVLDLAVVVIIGGASPTAQPSTKARPYCPSELRYERGSS